MQYFGISNAEKLCQRDDRDFTKNSLAPSYLVAEVYRQNSSYESLIPLFSVIQTDVIADLCLFILILCIVYLSQSLENQIPQSDLIFAHTFNTAGLFVKREHNPHKT